MVHWTAYIFFLFGVALDAMAAGDGHHGSASDLIAPAVNVAILAGFLILKLKGPLSQSFTKKSEDISNTLERASLKSKEAQVMLEAQKRKMSHLDHDLAEIKKSIDADLNNYKKIAEKEFDEKVQKLKSDTQQKIAAEKKAMLDELNNQILDQVVGKARVSIKNNKDYQNKVTTKLGQGLRA